MARHTAQDPAKSYPELDFMDLDASDLNTKRCEVEAFMRLHDFSIEEACEVVCFNPSDYPENFTPSPQSRIEYLPTPEMIKNDCRRFQRGWSPSQERERLGLGQDERLGKIADSPLSVCPQEC